MPYVYSTLANSVNFAIYEKKQAGEEKLPNRIKSHILVRGGAGVADAKTIVTPQGVATLVTDDQLSELQKMPTFNDFVKNGFYKVEGEKRSMQKATADMNAKDKSKPKTPDDPAFKDKTKKDKE